IPNKQAPHSMPTPLIPPPPPLPPLPFAGLSSIAFENGLLLGHECLISALVILRLHADRLRLGFGFDRVVDAHAPFLVNAALGHAMRERRACRDRIGQRFG